MKLNNPLVVGGKVFNEAGLSLAISPLYKENFLSASVVMTLTPIRREGEGFEVLNETQHKRSIIYSDVFSTNDPDIATCVAKIQIALQELIDKKGL